MTVHIVSDVQYDTDKDPFVITYDTVKQEFMAVGADHSTAPSHIYALDEDGEWTRLADFVDIPEDYAGVANFLRDFANQFAVPEATVRNQLNILNEQVKSNGKGWVSLDSTLGSYMVRALTESAK